MMDGLRVSFRVEKPEGTEVVMPIGTADGACYSVFYRYERRGSEWWAVLDRVKETMPAATPQVSRHDDQARVPMPYASDEAEQRRKEWAELNG